MFSFRKKIIYCCTKRVHTYTHGRQWASIRNNVERRAGCPFRSQQTRLNTLLMVSLIRTNWINVQEFVSASVLAGLRMEEIKGNKRDLYAFGMGEYVYVSIRMYVRMRVSGEKEQAREIEGGRKREESKGEESKTIGKWTSWAEREGTTWFVNAFIDRKSVV